MEGTAQGWSGLVLDGMRAMQGESVFTDVTLIAVDGSAVLAHSLVLAAGSAHFKDVSSVERHHLTRESVCSFVCTGEARQLLKDGSTERISCGNTTKIVCAHLRFWKLT